MSEIVDGIPSLTEYDTLASTHSMKRLMDRRINYNHYIVSRVLWEWGITWDEFEAEFIYQNLYRYNSAYEELRDRLYFLEACPRDFLRFFDASQTSRPELWEDIVLSWDSAIKVALLMARDSIDWKVWYNKNVEE